AGVQAARGARTHFRLCEAPFLEETLQLRVKLDGAASRARALRGPVRAAIDTDEEQPFAMRHAARALARRWPTVKAPRSSTTARVESGAVAHGRRHRRRGERARIGRARHALRGDEKRHGRPLADTTPHVDLPPVGFDDTPGDRKAEPGPARSRREERIERAM